MLRYSHGVFLWPYTCQSDEAELLLPVQEVVVSKISGLRSLNQDDFASSLKPLLFCSSSSTWNTVFVDTFFLSFLTRPVVVMNQRIKSCSISRRCIFIVHLYAEQLGTTDVLKLVGCGSICRPMVPSRPCQVMTFLMALSPLCLAVHRESLGTLTRCARRFRTPVCSRRLVRAALCFRHPILAFPGSLSRTRCSAYLSFVVLPQHVTRSVARLIPSCPLAATSQLVGCCKTVHFTVSRPAEFQLICLLWALGACCGLYLSRPTGTSR